MTDLSYRAAGVDREVAAGAKRRIMDLVSATAGPSVIPNPGGFGGLFRAPAGMRDPVLVASADGVGTKLKVAVRARRHGGVGEDIVNHCVNDILVEGARPLFFLDYIGMGRLEAGTVEQIVEGVARACRASGCALLGGETAEMPDVYARGEYDLAGFVVGVVENDARPGRHRVRDGDVLIALASDGFHTNGYSLLRRLFFDQLGLDIDDPWPGLDRRLGDVLLQPHRCYAAAVGPLIDAGLIHALAHITGGGIPENLERAMPDGHRAIVDRSSWTPPHEFRTVMERGAIADDEMFLTFNMGVGMVLVVAAESASSVLEQLGSAGERAWRAGHVDRGEHGVSIV
ncbi:MAG: phosphoribosylformylglycinamidine cyclo-ligase [Gemmatimonadetes bacterium]|nr:phosphoribosylformylglycinamidine cyclo-ligase [Gemmatimonadota bacterium]